MDFISYFLSIDLLGLILFATIILWDLFWKCMGMWSAGRNNQAIWFICILIFNTVGILPLVYLIWFRKDRPHKKRR